MDVDSTSSSDDAERSHLVRRGQAQATGAHGAPQPSGLFSTHTAQADTQPVRRRVRTKQRQWRNAAPAADGTAGSTGPPAVARSRGRGGRSTGIAAAAAAAGAAAAAAAAGAAAAAAVAASVVAGIAAAAVPAAAAEIHGSAADAGASAGTQAATQARPGRLRRQAASHALGEAAAEGQDGNDSSSSDTSSSSDDLFHPKRAARRTPAGRKRSPVSEFIRAMAGGSSGGGNRHRNVNVPGVTPDGSPDDSSSDGSSDADRAAGAGGLGAGFAAAVGAPPQAPSRETIQAETVFRYFSTKQLDPGLLYTVKVGQGVCGSVGMVLPDTSLPEFDGRRGLGTPNWEALHHRAWSSCRVNRLQFGSIAHDDALPAFFLKVVCVARNT